MDTRCPGKDGRGPQKPKSGLYGDRNQDFHHDSALYYSCRSGRVVIAIRMVACEGQPNQQILGEKMSGKVRDEGNGYAFTIPYKPRSSLFKAEGSSPGVSSATWTVSTPRYGKEVGCGEFARRYNGKWLSDVEETDIPDDIDVGEPTQPERPGLFSATWPWP